VRWGGAGLTARPASDASPVIEWAASALQLFGLAPLSIGSLGRAFASLKRAGSNGAMWTSLGNSSMSNARPSTARGGCW